METQSVVSIFFYLLRQDVGFLFRAVKDNNTMDQTDFVPGLFFSMWVKIVPVVTASQRSEYTSRKSSSCPLCYSPASLSQLSSSSFCDFARRESNASGQRPPRWQPEGYCRASMVRRLIKALRVCKSVVKSMSSVWSIISDQKQHVLYLLLIFFPAAPPGINVLEHESIALDMPNSYSTFHPPKTNGAKSFPPPAVSTVSPPSLKEEPFKPSYTPIVQPRELPRQRLPESFNLVTPLPSGFSLRNDCPVSLYRARMDNRNVVLRVLKGREGSGVDKRE